jgi:predicted PurR-regulated permease PerM
MLFFGASGVLIAAVLLAFREVLLPFLFAIVIAYVFEPVARRLTQWMPRWVAVIVVILGLLGVIGGLGAFAVPPIVVEVQRLTEEAPAMVRRARSEWLPAVEDELRSRMEEYAHSEVGSSDRAPMRGDEGGTMPSMDSGVPRHYESEAILVEPSRSGGYAVHLPPKGIEVHRDGNSYVVGAEPIREEDGQDLTATLTEALSRQVSSGEGTAVTFFRTVNSVVRGIVRGVFGFFLMLMIAAYLMITKDAIFGFFRRMVVLEKQARFDHLLHRIDRGLSGVVRGQLIIALVNGVLTGIGFYVLDLPYWPILTLVALVFSIIPIFGVIISSIPAVLVALQISFMTSFLVLAWIIIIHQLEANIFNPKIMGDAAKVHPVLVIFALLGGEHLFGLAGALLAVPVLSIAQSLFLHYREIALGIPSPTSSAGTVKAVDTG